MYSADKEFQLPEEERLSLVYPKPRQELFLNLVENYKIFYPNLKLIYAALNYNSELKVEYLIIFKAEAKGQKVILWDAPFLYTNRTIPAYRYAIKTNTHKQFFDSAFMHLVQMTYGKFLELVESPHCDNLSRDSKNKRYWKNPEFSEALIKGLSNCGMLFRPEGFISRRPSSTSNG